MIVRTGNKSAYRMQRVMRNNLRYYEIERHEGDLPSRAQTAPPPAEPIKMLNPIVVPSVTTALSVINKPGIERYNVKVAIDSFKQQLLAAGKLHAQSASILPSPPFDSLLSLPANLLSVNTQFFEAMTTNSLTASAAQFEQAGAFGTASHSVIERMITESVDIPVPSDLENIKKGFQEWKKQAELRALKILTIEEPVYSHIHKYAGTLDCLAVRSTAQGDIYCVIDWKTSNGIHQEYAMQLAAYAKAYEEMNPGIKINQGLVVKLSKTEPKFTVARVGNIDTAFEAFKSALNLHNLMTAGLLS